MIGFSRRLPRQTPGAHQGNSVRSPDIIGLEVYLSEICRRCLQGSESLAPTVTPGGNGNLILSLESSFSNRIANPLLFDETAVRVQLLTFRVLEIGSVDHWLNCARLMIGRLIQRQDGLKRELLISATRLKLLPTEWIAHHETAESVPNQDRELRVGLLLGSIQEELFVDIIHLITQGPTALHGLKPLMGIELNRDEYFRVLILLEVVDLLFPDDANACQFRGQFQLSKRGFTIEDDIPLAWGEDGATRSVPASSYTGEEVCNIAKNIAQGLVTTPIDSFNNQTLHELSKEEKFSQRVITALHTQWTLSLIPSHDLGRIWVESVVKALFPGESLQNSFTAGVLAGLSAAIVE